MAGSTEDEALGASRASPRGRDLSDLDHLRPVAEEVLAHLSSI